VELSSADFIVIVVLVVACCTVCSVGLWVMLRQAASERQRATEIQLNDLTAELHALEARVVAELGKIPEPHTLVVPSEDEAPAAAASQAVQREDEEVTPEMLVVIAAAVTAFLGKRVRVRSANKLTPPREAVSSWSQQGRSLVHGSHNPRLRS